MAQDSYPAATPAANLAEILASRARSRGWRRRTAYLLPEDPDARRRRGKRRVTFGEVHEGAARAAGVLGASGVLPGDRVLIAMSDTIEYVWAFLGTLRLGAMAVTTSPWLSEADHVHMLGDAAPAVVVCDGALAPRFPGIPVLAAGDLRDDPAFVPPVAAVTPDTAAYVQYTSGTTGAPKGVVHRHGDARVYFRAMAEGALRIRQGDVVLSASKAHHAYGLGNTILFPLLSGARAVLWPDPPTAAGIIERLREHRPTILLTVPSLYARLVAEPDVADGRVDFSSLRVAVSAGEPLLPALAARVGERLGCPVLDELGTTEVGQGFVCGNAFPPSRPRAIGKVLDPYEIEVRDAAGRPVAAGEIGMLHVRGPTVLLEYLNQPGKTAEALRPGGWLATGDLAHLDEDGVLYHHGRVNEQELAGGIPVSPLEAERVLACHEAVAEIAVTGDGAGSLRAFAALVSEWQACPQPVTPDEVEVLPWRDEFGDLGEELLRLASARLSPALVPRSVTFVRALPRGTTGKIQRSPLRTLGTDLLMASKGTTRSGWYEKHPVLDGS